MILKYIDRVMFIKPKKENLERFQNSKFLLVFISLLYQDVGKGLKFKLRGKDFGMIIQTIIP